MVRIDKKKGQIAIFVIIGFLFVVILVVLFLIRPRLEHKDEPSYMDPQNYMDDCMQEAAKEAISLISKQGGYINPPNYLPYKGNNLSYTCYNINFYQPCVMQTPQLIKHVSNQIKIYSEPKINNCFSALKQGLEKRGYDVSIDDKSYLEVEFGPRRVFLDIDRGFVMRKSGEVKSFDSFNSIIIDPIYDFAEIAQEISNQEARFCHAEYIGLSFSYPRFRIDKNQYGSGLTASKVYTIAEISSGREFLFAVRSCAMPGGL